MERTLRINLGRNPGLSWFSKQEGGHQACCPHYSGLRIPTHLPVVF